MFIIIDIIFRIKDIIESIPIQAIMLIIPATIVLLAVLSVIIEKWLSGVNY